MSRNSNQITNPNYKKESGFSLIGVIIATSIMSVMALGVASVIKMQFDSVATLEDRMSKVSFDQVLKTEFNSSSSCKNSLGGLDPRSHEGVVTIKNKDGDDIIKTGDSFDRINIPEITIMDYTFDSTTKKAKFNLNFRIQRERDGGGPKDMRPLEVKLDAQLDDEFKITSCNRVSDGGDGESDLKTVKGTCQSRYFSKAGHNEPFKKLSYVATCPDGYDVLSCKYQVQKAKRTMSYGHTLDFQVERGRCVLMGHRNTSNNERESLHSYEITCSATGSEPKNIYVKRGYTKDYRFEAVCIKTSDYD